MIESCVSIQQPGWLALRQALWPGSPESEHLAEMASFLQQPQRFGQFVAYALSREPIGLAEASLRNDYVNGTTTSPVLFLEGLYVKPEHRRAGVAARLVAAVAAWGRQGGCTEFASDAALDNGLSHAVHKALGFTEEERVVFFRKDLS